MEFCRVLVLSESGLFADIGERRRSVPPDRLGHCGGRRQPIARELIGRQLACGGQDAFRDRVNGGVIKELRSGWRDTGEFFVEPRIHLEDVDNPDLLFLIGRGLRPADAKIVAHGLVDVDQPLVDRHADERSEKHTYKLQSLMRNSYAVFSMKTKNTTTTNYL